MYKNDWICIYLQLMVAKQQLATQSKRPTNYPHVQSRIDTVSMKNFKKLDNLYVKIYFRSTLNFHLNAISSIGSYIFLWYLY